MICHNCGREEAYIRKTTKAYGTGDRLVVIENVPVISCRNCGVDLLSADTLDRLHELRSYLRSNPTNQPNERLVKVADFQAEVQPSSPAYQTNSNNFVAPSLTSGMIEALQMGDHNFRGLRALHDLFVYKQTSLN